jgi:hypothetical protein
VLPDALLPEDLPARDPLPEDLPAEVPLPDDSLLQAGLRADDLLRPGACRRPSSGPASAAAGPRCRRAVCPGMRSDLRSEARLLPVEVLLLLLVR